MSQFPAPTGTRPLRDAWKTLTANAAGNAAAPTTPLFSTSAPTGDGVLDMGQFESAELAIFMDGADNSDCEIYITGIDPVVDSSSVVIGYLEKLIGWLTYTASTLATPAGLITAAGTGVFGAATTGWVVPDTAAIPTGQSSTPNVAGLSALSGASTGVFAAFVPHTAANSHQVGGGFWAAGHRWVRCRVSTSAAAGADASKVTVLARRFSGSQALVKG